MKAFRLFGLILAVLLFSVAAFAAPVPPPRANITEEGVDLSLRSAEYMTPRAGHTPLDGIDRYVNPDGLCGGNNPCYTTIQAAIDASSAGDVIHVAAGSYAENLTVPVSVSIIGAGQLNTFLVPAVSDVGDDGSSGSLGNSQLIVVTADNVTISDMTLDGNNPLISTGHTVNGVDIDARNGIITGGSVAYNNLVVHHVTVQNIWLRGIQIRYGGTGFHFYDNTVQNVWGSAYSIAIFNSWGSGIIENNTVSWASDAISANYSKGTQFLNNVITNSSSGVHSDNNGGMGGLADLIQGNHVSSGGPNSYGIWVFFPYLNTVLDNNTVNDCDIGLFAWGGAGGVGQFTNNTVDGLGRTGCIGAYVTCMIDFWATWQSNVTANFTGNTVSNCAYGFLLETDETAPFFSATATVASHTTSNNVVDLYTWGLGPQSLTGLTPNTVLVGNPGVIQNGINWANVGGTVDVSAGTYFEHDIAINKSLTILGDPGDATPGPGPNAPVVDGQDLWGFGFKILNGVSNVTISGFEIRNYVGTLAGDGDAIVAWVNGTDHITVTDNYMHDLDWNGVLVGNDNGIAGHSYWTVARNRVENFGPSTFATSGYGLELSNTSHGVIEDNIVDAGTRSPGTGILIYFRGPSGQDILIQRNQVRGTYDFAGINVQASNEDVPSSNLDNVRILNNDVEISGSAIPAVQIRNKLGGTVTNAVVFDNRLINAAGYGAKNRDSETFNASGNWWGDNTPAGVAAKISGSVDYAPWLSVGTDLDPGPGFHGDFSVLWVDDNSPQSGTIGRIQEAINMVSGSTVNIAAGTYEEQLHITTNNLNLVGAGVGSTFINSPVSLPLFFMTSSPNHPVIWVDAAIGVAISNLTVDGLGRAAGNPRMEGIAYWNAGGSIHDLHVTNIGTLPFTGVEAVGVYAYNNSNGPYTLDITDVAVDNYAKNAFALNGNGNLTVNLLRVSTTGAGAITAIAQNGIQIWGGSGTITDCDVSGNAWIGSGWTAAGYLLIEGDFTVSGGCTSTNDQVGFDFDDASGSITGGSVSNGVSTLQYSDGVLVANWSAAAGGNHPRPQPLMDPVSVPGGSGLDDVGDETVTLSGMAITGAPTENYYGVEVWNDVAANVSLSLTGSNVSGWTNGLAIAGVGTVSPVTVSGNSFVNTTNAYDQYAGHTYANNCWSDFASNGGFPAQYNVTGGGGNADLNPNPNNCTDVNMAVSVPYMGCSGTCADGILYLTLDAATLPNLQLTIQMPAGFTATGGTVTPAANKDPNLIQAFASSVGGVLTVDMGFQGSGSSGGGLLYVAAIPIHSVGVASGTWTFAGMGSLWTDSNGGDHLNQMMLGGVDVAVDCTAPAAPATFSNSVTCSFGPGNVPADAFSVTGLTMDGTPAPISSVWITFNGNSTPTFPITLSGNDPYSFTFPSPGSETAFYGMLDDLEGCNTVNLHVTDAACNMASYDLLNVGWDQTAPSITGAPVTPATVYGNGTYLQLDDDLSILGDLLTGSCVGTTGTFTIWYNNPAANLSFALPRGEWPGSDAEATAFWTYLQGQVPSAANGELYTFNARACDCSGNCYGTTFGLYIDLVAPTNTVSGFDARPADAGVWLKWAWTSGPDAVEMRIYRSEISGGYPGYNPPQRDVYTATLPTTGWTLAVTQTSASSDFSSADVDAADVNLRGDFHQHVAPSGTYWLDADVLWVNSNGNASAFRDIYRYVTFVKDAGGNWSTGYTVGTNADHSTNYWLGDFSTADVDNGPDESRGRVDQDDLALLSGVYFSNSGPHYANIGPVITENGNVGKGIPNPDGIINFQDLVPFSFNYAMVSPVGLTGTEFRVEPSPADLKPFGTLDDQPVVQMSRTSEEQLAEGDEFTLAVTLSGNDADVVKAAEAGLEFDPTVFEFVSATEAQTSVDEEAILFSKAAPISGEDGKVGMVAAACGNVSTLHGNFALATVTLRVKKSDEPFTRLELSNVKLLDNTGSSMDAPGTTLTLGGGTFVPNTYALHQNYPNPFNPSTSIHYDLREAGFVSIRVFNVLGQEVATLVNGDMPAGRHVVNFDATDLSSGLYVYTIQCNGFSDRKKMLLMR